MNKELKEHMHKEFEDKASKGASKGGFLADYYDDYDAVDFDTDLILNFIDSLIDKSYEKGYSDCWNQFKDMDAYQLGVQSERERIVKEMKDWANQNYRQSTQPIYAWVDAKDLIDELSLITNKSDINNNKE